MQQQPEFTLPEIDPQFNPLITLDDRESGGRDADDAKLFVQFHIKPVMNPLKSTEAGRPVFDEVEYIRIRIPGSQLSCIDAPYKEYRGRFVNAYNKWKANQAEAISGTPLDSFPFLFGKIALVAELKAMNIHTVEQLANLADVWAQKIMGGLELRSRAAAWIDESTGTDAQIAKLAQENENQKNELETLKAQMAELIASNQAAQAAAISKPTAEAAPKPTAEAAPKPAPVANTKV